MLRKIKGWVISKLETVGRVINQTPTPAEATGTSSTKRSPLVNRDSSNEKEKKVIDRDKINSRIQRRPKGEPHAETKIFNHPRK